MMKASSESQVSTNEAAEAVPAKQCGDEDLMTRVAAGELGLFEELYSRHFGGVSRFAMRVFGMGPMDAEGAAQTVFMKVFKAAGRYNVRAKFTSYLYKVARNECLKIVVKKRPVPVGSAGSDETGAVEEDESGRDIEGRELGECIAKVMGMLSLEQRTAVQLRDAEELSYDDIALSMDATVAAVNTWIHRGRKRFMERFRELYGDVYPL